MVALQEAEEYRPKLKPGAQNALRWMEGSVLIALASVFISGVASIYGAQKVFEAFDGNCIYTSNISFVSRAESPSVVQPPFGPYPRNNTSSSSNVKTTTTMLPPTTMATSPKPRTKKIGHIFRALEPAFPGEDEFDVEDDADRARDAAVTKEEVGNPADFEFLSTMQVDIMKTLWAPLGFCDYVLYNQVFSVIVGMISTTMLILYNTAGKSQLDWGIPKPWRIVFPAAITFGIMTIASLAHVIVIFRAYQNFCSGLSKELRNKSMPCTTLINALYPLISMTWLKPGHHYTLHVINVRITFVAWLISFIIMVARMFFVIDFRLVRVTISAFATKQKPIPADSGSSDSVDEKNAEKMDEGAKVLDTKTQTDRSQSSREDLDEFHSAHSDAEATDRKPATSQPLLAEPRPGTSKDVQM